jgi:hypothetical protein
MVRLGQRALHREPSPFALLWGALAGLLVTLSTEIAARSAAAMHFAWLVAALPAIFCTGFKAPAAQARWWLQRRREIAGPAYTYGGNRENTGVGSGGAAVVEFGQNGPIAPLSEELYGGLISSTVGIAAAALCYVCLISMGISAHEKEELRRVGPIGVAAFAVAGVAVPLLRRLILRLSVSQTKKND